MQSCLPLSLTSSIEIWGYWWWLKTDNLKRLTMSNKEATGDDKNHGRLFHLTTIYFLMLKNISTTTIQTLLTDRKFSHLWIELIHCFTLFKIKKCTLVVKNKYTKGKNNEYSLAFFEMLKINKVNWQNSNPALCNAWNLMDYRKMQYHLKSEVERMTSEANIISSKYKTISSTKLRE